MILSIVNQKAKLFDSQMLNWGEMTVSTKSGVQENYLYIVTDLTIRFPDPVK